MQNPIKMISKKNKLQSFKSIEVPCKPYVKRFLVQNFGDPVNLYSIQNQYIYLFRSFLAKPCKRRDKKLAFKSTLTDSVEFMISDTDFYHYGWEISVTDMSTLNSTFEQAAKIFMRSCISIDASISGNLAQSIRRFQDLYEYPDSVWPFDSIKKDLDRNIPSDKIDFETEIYSKIQKIVMGILAKSGTITKINPITNEFNSKRTKQPRGDRQNLGDPGSPDLFTGTK
ncbi:MAG TPA: hypothetical protein DC042_14970 [Bacteroidales bacterium]|nr:hypothetical protein [Bacteroidales bacterium]